MDKIKEKISELSLNNKFIDSYKIEDIDSLENKDNFSEKLKE